MKNKSFNITALIVALLILISGLAVGSYFMLFQPSGYDVVESTSLSTTQSTENHVQVETQTVATTQVHDGDVDTTDETLSILLIGIDTRQSDYKGRSDSLILMQLNPMHQRIKLLSFMRDLYVSIPDHGYQKLGHAYAYGQEALVIETLAENFGIRSDYYATFNFKDIIQLVDQVGGIDVAMRPAEVEHLNTLLVDVTTDPTNNLALIGDDLAEYHLNGLQALSYMRIRKTGNGDFERTARQRSIIVKIIQKLATYDIEQLLGLIKHKQMLLRTNIDLKELLSYYRFFIDDASTMTIQSKRIPSDGSFREVTIDGLYYLKIDDKWDIAAEIETFLFDDHLLDE